MRKYAVLMLVVLLGFVVAGRLMADPGSWNVTFDNLNALTVEHDDQEPFKGWATVNIFNDTEEYWTDFHFQIGPAAGVTGTPTTIFVDGMIGGTNYDPISSQTPFTWSITNNQQTMNLFFFNDQIAPGESASFTVYTDNTSWRKRFALCMYPTVPEPSSLLAMGGSLVGLLGFAMRKRS